MLISFIWFILLLFIRTTSSRLPCLKFDCRFQLPFSSNSSCSDCSQCRTDRGRFCLLEDEECECADLIPPSCIPNIENNSVQICFVPANFYLNTLYINTDDENSITVEVDRFWENEEEDLHFRNLTLNAVYAVKDPIDCTNYDQFAQAKLVENNTCYTKYRIPMPSIDYTSDDAYYYDDHQNPMIQFDRQIFDESCPIIFWHEVKARKLSLLPINVTVFFQFPMKSTNITYFIPPAKGSPAIRSAPESELLLYHHESYREDRDQSSESDQCRVARRRRARSLSVSLKTRAVSLRLFLAKCADPMKYFARMILSGIAFVFLCIILCDASIWFFLVFANELKKR